MVETGKLLPTPIVTMAGALSSEMALPAETATLGKLLRAMASMMLGLIVAEAGEFGPLRPIPQAWAGTAPVTCPRSTGPSVAWLAIASHSAGTGA